MKKSKFLPAILSITTLASSVALPYNTFADSSDTAEVKITVAETLALTLSSDAINFDLSDENFHSNSMTVTGSTNSPNGYTISFNANNDYNDLKHSNASVTDKIESLTEDKTEANFPATAWGFSTDAETFKQVPLISTSIFETTAKGQNAHTFTAGAKATKTTTAGDYENELIFTIVANTSGNFSLSNIVYMQDMTPEICANTPTPSIDDGNNTPYFRLIDIRDNKQYWVAKLADGNCWMTQDLDLDIDNTKTYTPADTDISHDWTPITSTSPVGSVRDSSTMDCYKSYDQGEKYYDKDCSYYYLDQCMINETPSDENGGEHAHIGNEYALCSARAIDLINPWEYELGEDSICPAGWRLPEEDDDSNEYIGLALWYGGVDKGYEIQIDSVFKTPIYFLPGSYWSESDKTYTSLNSDGLMSSVYRTTNNYATTNPHLIRCVAR